MNEVRLKPVESWPELDTQLSSGCLTCDDATLEASCIEGPSLSLRATQEMSGSTEVTAKKMSSKAVFLILAFCVLIPPLSIVFGAFIIYWINKKEEVPEKGNVITEVKRAGGEQEVEIIEDLADLKEEDSWRRCRWVDFLSKHGEILWGGEMIRKERAGPSTEIDIKQEKEEWIQAIRSRFPKLSEEDILDIVLFVKEETFASLYIEIILPHEGALSPLGTDGSEQFNRLEIIQTSENNWRVQVSSVFEADLEKVKLTPGKNGVKGTLVINPFKYFINDEGKRAYKGSLTLEEIVLPHQ